MQPWCTDQLRCADFLGCKTVTRAEKLPSQLAPGSPRKYAKAVEPEVPWAIAALCTDTITFQFYDPQSPDHPTSHARQMMESSARVAVCRSDAIHSHTRHSGNDVEPSNISSL